MTPCAGGFPRRVFFSIATARCREIGGRMWIDDLSLVSLEEVDWKVGASREELNATMRDDDFLEESRFDDTWRGSGMEVF